MSIAAILHVFTLVILAYGRLEKEQDVVSHASLSDETRLALWMLALNPASRFQASTLRSTSRLGSLNRDRRVANSELTMGMMDFLKKISDPTGEGPPKPKYETLADKWFTGDSSTSEEDSNEPANLGAQTYIDPSDASNYLTVELAKPMGIVLEEEDGLDEGESAVFIGSFQEEGSASKLANPLMKKDLLVGVGSINTRGRNLDQVLEEIQSGATSMKLTFYRGPSTFLYGPTAPDDKWYQNLLSERNKREAAEGDDE